MFIVDEQVYVGSSNLDARSLNINYELLVRFSDPSVVNEAHSIFAEVLALCRRIELTSWRRSRNPLDEADGAVGLLCPRPDDPWWREEGEVLALGVRRQL